MDYKLGIMTIGILHEPIGMERVQGFVDRIPGIFAAAHVSSGFLGMSLRNPETNEHSWGKVVMPACFSDYPDPRQLPITLSTWRDLESLHAFAYSGLHGEAMKLRNEWFGSFEQPNYVLWWAPADRHIDWQEASGRLDHLHEFGPTARAFTFGHSFDPAGKPVRPDREAINKMVEANKTAWAAAAS